MQLEADSVVSRADLFRRFNSILVQLEATRLNTSLQSYDLRFNSILVQLEALMARTTGQLPIEFQFHIGAIRRTKLTGTILAMI